MNSKLLRQILIMSKYSLYGFILQCMFHTLVFAHSGLAQEPSVNDIDIVLSQQDVTVIQVFNEITEQAGFDFHFNEIATDLSQRLSVDNLSISVGDVLRLISKNSGMRFKRVDQDIFVKRKTKNRKSIEETFKDRLLALVSGTIKDAETGELLPGVNILIKGSTSGTVTDVAGAYQIETEINTTLVFSFIGYVSQEVVVGSQTTIDISMVSDISVLSEVVVTGYTSQSRRSITGSVESVDPVQLEKNPSTSIEQKLQGQIAGVNVIGSGRPGAGINVRIRGYGTTGDNDPLYIIDGVPWPIGQGLNELNPDDIESMSVIKDASAASIYGARGANGVVLITTKKGKKGQAPQITLSSYISIDSDPSKQDLLNAQQWADMEFQGQAAAGLTPTHPTLGTGATPVIPEYLNGDPSLPYDVATNRLMRSADTDWFDATTETGFSQNHNLGITGGGENSRYGISFAYLSRDGAVANTGFDRYSTRVNAEFSALDNRLRIGENLSVSYSEEHGASPGDRYLFNPIIPVFDEGGDFGGTLNGVLGLGTNQRNPVAVLSRNRNHIDRTLRVFGNAYIEFDIIPQLTVKSSIGINYRQRNNSAFNPEFTEGGNPGNSLNEFSGWDTDVIWTNTLNYLRDFGNHSIGMLIGSESIETKNQFSSTSVQNFFSEDPAFTYISSGSVSTLTNTGLGSQRNLSSLFAKVDYAFKNKYILNATVRRDGSSALGANNRYDVFPAVGAGWIISDESFLNSSSFIGLLKLRAGWGITGNQNSLTDFAFASRFAQDPASTGYDLSASNGGFTTGVGLLARGNPDLVWETSETINIGVDFSILDNKLSGSLEWYDRTTNDLIVSAPIPLLAGVASPPFINVGEIENKGVDFSLTYSDNIGELSFDVTGIVSNYKNKVIDIDGNPETFIDGRFGNPNIVASRTQAGQELSAFYGLIVDGVIQSGPGVGNFDFRDLNSDEAIDPNDDQDYIGSPHPDFTYSLNINAYFKNFDFTVLFRGSEGNDIWNATKIGTDFQFRSGGNRSTRVLNAWRPDNPTNELAEFNLNTATGNLQASSYYIEDGSYLKLQTVQLGYTFQNIAFIDNLRVYLQGQNLFTITDYSGIDPEVQEDGGSLDKGTDTGGIFAIPRSFLLGVNVRF